MLLATEIATGYLAYRFALLGLMPRLTEKQAKLRAEAENAGIASAKLRRNLELIRLRAKQARTQPTATNWEMITAELNEANSHVAGLFEFVRDQIKRRGA